VGAYSGYAAVPVAHHAVVAPAVHRHHGYGK
jgi:hypothetical protein